MSSWSSAVLEQKRSNLESWPYKATFATHRQRLTELATEASPKGRLCVLGAGNCSDLDLDLVLRSYEQVHLVDLDGEALSRAISSIKAPNAERVTIHEDVDVSGLRDCLERWAAHQLVPEELMDYPRDTAHALRQRLGGPFDRVLSSCLLSQMHLMARRVLTEHHPLANAVAFCLNVAHLHTLLELVSPGGEAILVSDVTSNAIVPLNSKVSKRPLKALSWLLEARKVFEAVDPRLLSAILRDDPTLRARARLSEPQAAWVWQNGPRRRFLVYAAKLAPTETPSGVELNPT